MEDLRHYPAVSTCDFEQHIMETWNITNDLDVLFEYLCDGDGNLDTASNIVLGMKQLYELRFNKLFGMYENLLHHNRLGTNVT